MSKERKKMERVAEMAEMERLRMENENKTRQIEILQREIGIYKDLFEKSGFVALVPK